MNDHSIRSGNAVRQALQAGRTSLGSWLQIGHPTAAALMAQAGFDWLAVDMEHTEIGLDTLATMVAALRPTGCVPLVRVRDHDTLTIRQVLDVGAQGVIVPMVNTADQAQQAVAAAKYPPEGVRGFAFCQANGWGQHFDDYARTANAATLVIAMVEHRQAVDNLDTILAVEGLDGVFVGPYDLSGSYGLPGQTSHPLVRTACERVVGQARHHGKAAGLHVVLPTAAAVGEAVASGMTFLALGMDTVFLGQGATAARALVNSDS